MHDMAQGACPFYILVVLTPARCLEWHQFGLLTGQRRFIFCCSTRQRLRVNLARVLGPKVC